MHPWICALPEADISSCNTHQVGAPVSWATFLESLEARHEAEEVAVAPKEAWHQFREDVCVAVRVLNLQAQRSRLEEQRVEVRCHSLHCDASAGTSLCVDQVGEFI